jgi:hypothetical protein
MAKFCFPLAPAEERLFWLCMLWGVDPIGIVHRYVIFTGMNKISINSSGVAALKNSPLHIFGAGGRICKLHLTFFDWLQIARSFIATFVCLFRFPVKSKWHFKS